MTDTKTVLLAGASGFFGRRVSEALHQAGYRVKSLGRGPANDISADLLHRAELIQAIKGHQVDVVVHAATALRKPPLRERDMAPTNALRIEGTRNLIEAARALGATKFISESMVFGYGFGDHGPRPLSEDTPLGTGPVQDAIRAKEEMTFEYGNGVALRFGLFHGTGGATEEIVSLLRKRMLPVVKSSHLLPWVELTSAARAVVAAIEHGRPGEAYNIADEHMSFGARVQAIADAYKTPKPLTIPLWMLRPMSYLHTMLSTNLIVDTTKAVGWDRP
ncbi:NAD-dependent epimerase/dehydratase family protein [Allorhizocola rhizosphaerae]|uniref:NAD-dependent epimerase/dehydratase family protein n=1 Tax=Allorhizocola rhizosphaerae TaxID=1872709 RepID=UPI000E3E1EF1|nr:NAD(P)-dependent oxidoreductase [Allorhizocola rhizosphaerae]